MIKIDMTVLSSMYEKVLKNIDEISISMADTSDPVYSQACEVYCESLQKYAEVLQSIIALESVINNYGYDVPEIIKPRREEINDQIQHLRQQYVTYRGNDESYLLSLQQMLERAFAERSELDHVIGIYNHIVCYFGELPGGE